MRRLFYSLFFILLCGCIFLDNAQSLRRKDKNANFFIPDSVFQIDKKQEKLPSVQQMHYQGELAPVVVEIEQEKLDKLEAEKIRLEKEKRKAYIEKKVLQKKEEQKKENYVKDEILNPEIQESSTLGYQQIMYEYKRDLENISKGLPVQNLRLEQVISDFNEEVHTVE
jgi:hypothetical protein